MCLQDNFYLWLFCLCGGSQCLKANGTAVSFVGVIPPCPAPKVGDAGERFITGAARPESL